MVVGKTSAPLGHQTKGIAVDGTLLAWTARTVALAALIGLAWAVHMWGFGDLLDCCPHEAGEDA